MLKIKRKIVRDTGKGGGGVRFVQSSQKNLRVLKTHLKYITLNVIRLLLIIMLLFCLFVVIYYQLVFVTSSHIVLGSLGPPVNGK